jgi:hypothetical protein
MEKKDNFEKNNKLKKDNTSDLKTPNEINNEIKKKAKDKRLAENLKKNIQRRKNFEE